MRPKNEWIGTVGGNEENINFEPRPILSVVKLMVFIFYLVASDILLQKLNPVFVSA